MTRHAVTAFVLSSLVAAVAGSPARGFAVEGKDQHVNAYYVLPKEPEVDYFNLDVTLTPLIDPVPNSSVWPAFFYANSFSFRAFEADGVERSGCAYMRMQTDRNGKRAIFSIWGGIAASSTTPGARVAPFEEISCSGYDGGWHVMVPLRPIVRGPRQLRPCLSTERAPARTCL